jgi:hypothetical protein
MEPNLDIAPFDPIITQQYRLVMNTPKGGNMVVISHAYYECLNAGLDLASRRY